MMNRGFLIFTVLIPLMFSGCDKKETARELPPPVIGDDEDNKGKTDDDGDNKNPWDANRGKVVTPSGANWTSKTIDDGVVYYTFDGKDDISGVKQQVFVIDLDLSKTRYTVKLVETNPRKVTSEAFKLEDGTIAAMNANYEPGSIYIRVNATLISNLPNSTIGDTGVPNWKSEAAFSTDRKQGVKIFFVGSQKKGEMTVAQQRSYFGTVSSITAPDLISSAPMLIDDYKPVGDSFCDFSLSLDQAKKLNSEHPDNHQRVRHPRSAVALTENNHFIMLVVDGRTNYSLGMSAQELTDFFVKNFNPQYALNMDGGGSSCMCVKGEGDSSTHVVNYPCDNSKHDHAGERSRDIHFVIVKK